ncbi:hypothetical protein BG846_01927 [Streptomyces fradiae ATCC 10745 = DSM 40063]|uniref:Uncharacterized protein n=1 Tax=Streptomyces fradiae ATCC 10745 = DSM 40063 TaxID=1319510 RepID=A0A1Y2NY19_STRFR|nr:hypothetical protein BG846_01927 [Streptomyces fradiae ATCC 10745 = DSM 40063]
MQAQAGHPGTPPGHPAPRVDRADRLQHRTRRRHRTRRGSVQQGQPRRVGVAPRRGLQREPRQVRHPDLRRRIRREPPVLRLGPAPVHRARRLTPGPPGPLPRRRARRTYRRQGAEPPRVVHPRLTGQARVDHDPHPRHRQGRLGDRRRQDHPPPPARRQHRLLHRGGRPAVHLEHLHPAQVRQQPRHTGDLTHTRQETQHVTVTLAQRPPHHPRHMRQQRRIHEHPVRRPHRLARRGPHDLHRVRRTRRRHDGRAAQQPRPPLGVRRRRGGHQPQLGPQRRPHVQQERRDRVRVQMPLMALVEDDHVHPGQLLVPLEALEQHAGRHHLDGGLPRHHPLAPHGEPDPAADLLAQQPRHAPGRSPRGDPPGLRHDHPRAPLRQRQRHQRGLARAGRRAQHRRPVPVQRPLQCGQGVPYGKALPLLLADHPVTPPRRGGRARPARTRTPPYRG